MKKVLSVFVLGQALLLGGLAVADHDDANHPCHKIKEACKAAGFQKGDHKDKKGLWKDCMDPILKGQSVSGVNVDKAEVDACSAKKTEWKAKHNKG